VISGEPAVTTVCLLPLHTGCGCIGHPAFPTPSFRAEDIADLGRVLASRDVKACPVLWDRHSGAMRSIELRCALHIGESRDSGSGAEAPSRNDGIWISWRSPAIPYASWPRAIWIRPLPWA